MEKTGEVKLKTGEIVPITNDKTLADAIALLTNNTLSREQTLKWKEEIKKYKEGIEAKKTTELKEEEKNEPSLLPEKGKEIIKSTEPEKPDDEKIEELSGKIGVKVEEDFTIKIADKLRAEFGLTEKDLSNDFTSLSSEQKSFVLANLEQIKYKHVKETGVQRFQQELKDSNFLSRFFKNFAREAKIKKYERKSFYTHNEETYAKALQQITLGLKRVGVASEQIPGTDSFAINFLSKETVAGNEELANELNEKVTAFSKIPAEWGYWEGTTHDKMTWLNKEGAEAKENYEKYLAAKEDYDDVLQRAQLAQQEAMKFQGVPEDAVVQEIFKTKRTIESKVQFLRQLQSNPDAEALLQEISEQVNTPWWKKITGVAKGFKTSTVIGASSRIALKSYMGISAQIAGPAVASIVGGFRAWRNAEKNISDRKKLVREGKIENSKELGTFVNLDDWKNQRGTGVKGGLNKLKEAIDLAKNPENKNRVSDQEKLRLRLAYMIQKYDAGLINFGSGDTILRKAEFLATLEEGANSVLCESTEVRSVVEERLESVMNSFEQGKKSARNWYKAKQIALGVITGGIISFIAGEATGEVKSVSHELYEKYFGEHVSDQAVGEIPPATGAPQEPVNSSPRPVIHNTISRGAKIEGMTPHGGLIQPAELEPVHTDNTELMAGMKEMVRAHGISHDNVSFKLGENGIPSQLERVFHVITADHMKIDPTATINEEVGAKSLNMAANLVKLAEGHSVAGISASDFEKIAHFDAGKEILEIKDHMAFNEMVGKLEGNADKLWDTHVLQGNGAAMSYLNNISQKTSEAIFGADHMQNIDGTDTGIVGHHNEVMDFGKNDIIEKANAGVHHAASMGSGQHIDGFDPSKLDTIDTLNHGGAGADFDPSNLSTGNLHDTGGISPEDLVRRGDSFDPSHLEGNNLNDQGMATRIPPRATLHNEVQTPNGNEIQKDQPDISTLHKEPEVPKASPGAIVPGTPEAANHGILEKIFGQKDIENNKVWEFLHDKPATEIFNTKPADILQKNADTQELWSYVKMLSARTGIKPSSTDTIEEYIQKTSKEYLGMDGNNGLSYIYERSGIYLKDLKETK